MILFLAPCGIGAAHFTRGWSLRQAFRRRDITPALRVAGPPLPIRDVESYGYTPNWNLGEAVRSAEPDLVIVDVEANTGRIALASAGYRGQRWLLVRDGDRWGHTDVRDWDRVLTMETLRHPSAPEVESIDPVLPVNPDEVVDVEEFHRQMARRGALMPTAVALETLHPRPGHVGHRAVPGYATVFLSLRDREPLFPAARYLPHAAVVVTNATTTAVWEARWVGYDARCRFVVQDYDARPMADRAAAVGRPSANGADTLAALVEEWA